METFKAILTRIEVREFSGEPVPLEQQVKVLEAGRAAASAYNRQPWNFVLINDKKLLNRIGELATTGPYIANSQFAVAVYVDPKNTFHVVDGTRAVQNMMLAAWDMGLGSCWVNGIEREKVSQILGAPPEMYLLTIIPFGKPSKKYKGKKSRKPLSEIAFLNSYERHLTEQ
ncbi:MAG: nitroreductase family protein [Nitrososphaerota archaeon]|nr:nitroreductase family protein [Nitrososphaerota archaeon]MDG6928277.1 nitroreductase family protein [Nitrososphaerota archaeon]MDG6929739.1 nitroreductase family protein [Nitrososphaerota archaeon]MDG6932825.1 nitroreductase family protein [Nitrososphaerota archaeon]MDG6935376.1 nitroreductase family protein [Nitrososphaerota archaeon]